MRDHGSAEFMNKIACRKAHHLALTVCDLMKRTSKEEVREIVVQIRRAASSLAATTAEAFETKEMTDKSRILKLSQRALSETQCYLMVLKSMKHDEADRMLGSAEEISMLLEAYRKL